MHVHIPLSFINGHVQFQPWAPQILLTIAESVPPHRTISSLYMSLSCHLNAEPNLYGYYPRSSGNRVFRFPHVLEKRYNLQNAASPILSPMCAVYAQKNHSNAD